jgi:hypothetical protein
MNTSWPNFRVDAVLSWKEHPHDPALFHPGLHLADEKCIAPGTHNLCSKNGVNEIKKLSLGYAESSFAVCIVAMSRQYPRRVPEMKKAT